MVLIELPADFNDKDTIKMVKRINEAHEKGKTEKFNVEFQQILKDLGANSPNSHILLYILSIIAEELPEKITDASIGVIEPFLESKNAKSKMNSIIIYGTYLTFKVASKHAPDQAKVEKFINLLTDESGDVRQNISAYLEEIIESMPNLLMAKLNFFLDPILGKEKNPEVLKMLKKLLLTIQPKLTLGLLSTYINKLIMLYSDSDNPERTDVILSLLEIEMPVLKTRKTKNTSKKEIIQLIEKRPPMTRIYDVKKIASEEGMKEDDVEQRLMATPDETVIFPFSFTEKNRKFVVEFETAPLIAWIGESKIKLDRVFQQFQTEMQNNISVVPIFLKSLIKEHMIRGYISKEYFYPYEFIKKEVQSQLLKEGKLNIETYVSFLSAEFVNQIQNDIIQQGSFTGIYDNSKKNFFTMRMIIKEIEQQAAKSNIIDLSSYSDRFAYDDFLRIEEHGRKHLFTPYHQKHLWLSNLGLTRIQTFLRTSEQIGEFEPVSAAKKLEIPVEILKDATKDYFPHINGFWNSSNTKFYYAKFMKAQIAKIQGESDLQKREKLMDQLAKDLNIDKKEIAKKVDEKLHMLAEKLKTEEEFEINPLLRQLQMDQAEFLKFVENMEKSYLLSGGKIIFSEKRIKAEKEHLKEQILRELENQDQADMERLSARLKCGKPMITDLFKELITAGKIKGLWTKPDSFLTDKGIRSKMLKSKNYFALNTFIENQDLEETEIKYLESIVRDLIESNRIVGIYDEALKIFQSHDAVADADIEADRKRLTTEISNYIKDMELTYQTIKEIFLGEDISPAQIEQYEAMLADCLRRMITGETFVKRIINNADARNRRRKPKPAPARGKKLPAAEEEDAEPSFAEDEIVKKAMDDFNNWKKLLMAIDQKANQLIFHKKKVKMNPNDDENVLKYANLMKFLGFTD